MMSKEDFTRNTNWKMSYEQYQKCYCPKCERDDCIHRNAFRRVPKIDGGLGLCPNLKASYKLRVYKTDRINKGNLDHEEFFSTREEMDKRYHELFVYANYGLNPTAWEKINEEWYRLEGY